MARRLTKELASFQSDPLDYATAVLVGDDIRHWHVALKGPEGTPYAGGVFNLNLEFPSEYPFKPAKVMFLTKVYHPSVKSDTGEICAEVLGDSWGPTLNVRYVLNILRQMLAEPATDHPLEAEIARQIQEDHDAYAKTAAKWTSQFAK